MYGSSDPNIRLGQYLCHTIQDHRVMKEFREADFHRHTSTSPSVVNHLFEHRVGKIDVDVLKGKN